jgi:hypothetical protein
MRRVLSPLVLAAVIASALSAPAVEAAPLRAPGAEFLMSRVWSVVEFFAARFSAAATKDASLMDPHG